MHGGNRCVRRGLDSLVRPASLLLACLLSASFLFGGGDWVVVAVWTVLDTRSVSAGSGSVTISSADSLANSNSE